MKKNYFPPLENRVCCCRYASLLCLFPVLMVSYFTPIKLDGVLHSVLMCGFGIHYFMKLKYDH